MEYVAFGVTLVVFVAVISLKIKVLQPLAARRIDEALRKGKRDRAAKCEELARVIDAEPLADVKAKAPISHRSRQHRLTVMRRAAAAAKTQRLAELQQVKLATEYYADSGLEQL